LTQRMLSFARRQQMQAVAVDPAKLVEGMTDLLDSTLGSEVEIVTDFPSLPRMVMVDENQLELALLNLCVNARDAMKTGGRIVISAREEQVPAGGPGDLAAGSYLCLSVADTGEGMSPETIARATEPFFTTKGVGKGTGLGLSMVHGMAEQMGGRLILKSKLGEGTTAEIWLPISDTMQAKSGEDSRQTPSVSAPPSLRVLAVDDDRLVLFNTVAMLEDMGHCVFEATSGEEALDLLRRQSFDLVITDQAMPRMTGAQLMSAIRKDWPDLPIILATGFAEIPGGTDVKAPILSKPFTETDLTRVLAGLVH